jgi:hypothetical protein
VNPRVIALALTLAGASHLCASASDTRAPAASETFAQAQLIVDAVAAQRPSRPPGRLPTVAPDLLVPAFVASSPFAAIESASLPREIATLPRREIKALNSTPLKAPPHPERLDCDPSYPEDRTCIPPGPPFDQGCAITHERRFTVLAPDPQRLDHDRDGIGCEPIR